LALYHRPDPVLDNVGARRSGVGVGALPYVVFAVGTLATLAIFGTYFYAAGGVGIFSDGIGYYAPLRSIAFDGNLEVSNEYQYFAETVSNLSGESRWPFPIPRFSKYTIGVAAVLSPFFLLGHLFALLLQRVGVPIAANGLSWPYELFYSMGSAILGICGMYLAYRAAKARVGVFAAAIAVAGIWFASSLFYYVVVVPSMSHAVSQFLVSAFLYLALTQDWLGQTRPRVLMGLTLGLACLVRPQDVLFGVVPLCLILLKWRSERRVAPRDLIALCWIGCAVALAAMLQLFVYKIQFRELAQIPYVVEGAAIQRRMASALRGPRLGSVLFWGSGGLFAWHPMVLLAVVGAFLSIRRHKESIALLLAFLLQACLIASWYAGWQGASFGGRMFSSCSLIFVMGLASLWSHAGRSRSRLLVVLLTLACVVWNLLLTLQYAARMIPAGDMFPTGQIIENQFEALPLFLERFMPR
jgi:hypothetical protein